MGSMAPDWRVVGATSLPEDGPRPTDQAPTRVSTRHVAWALAALVAAVMVGAMAALLVMPGTGGVVVGSAGGDGDWTERGGAGSEVGGLVPDLPRAVDVAQRVLVVDVEGAVLRPGLVTVGAGARVGEAIELAGGFAPDADLIGAAGALNLAQAVTDGLKVVVPAIGDPASGDRAAPADASDGPIDLNRATEPELDSLPGVGPATIARIVTAREEAPFATVDELRSRGVVGEATFDKLRDLVTVGH